MASISTKLCYLNFALTHLFGVACIVITTKYMDLDETGFRRYGKSMRETFKVHPVLATTFMLVFHGQGLVVYRGLRFASKPFLKGLHAAIHVVTLFHVALSLKAVFDCDHFKPNPKPHITNAHGWLGVMTVGLYGAQVVQGLATYYNPAASARIRSATLPFHRTCGLLMFVLALGESLHGIAMGGNVHCPGGAAFCAEKWYVNLIASTMALYGLSVLFMNSTNRSSPSTQINMDSGLGHSHNVSHDYSYLQQLPPPQNHSYYTWKELVFFHKQRLLVDQSANTIFPSSSSETNITAGSL